MLKYVPAVLGAALVVAGVAVIFWPLALITAGLFLLALDHRITPPGPKTARRSPRDEVR